MNRKTLMSPCKPLYATSQRANSPSDVTNSNRHDVSLLRYLRLLVAVTVDYCEPHEDKSSQLVAHLSERNRVQNYAAISSKSLVASIRNTATTFLNSINIYDETPHVRPPSIRILQHSNSDYS